MKTLSARQESILNRVVDTHIQTALPVGSEHITALYQDLYRSSYSPATVRNEMGSLEDMGYLTHPHTSAGRVPTDAGYRYYVDHSLQEETLAENFIRQIETELEGLLESPADFGEEVSRILSKATGEVSVFMQSPNHSGFRSGKSFRICVQGSSCVLEKPEFQSVGKAHGFLKALEEKESLAEWLIESTSESGVSIRIGRENRREVFSSCTLISARTIRANGFFNTIAVLGPQRMKYSKMIPMVSQIARMISRVLNVEEN